MLRIAVQSKGRLYDETMMLLEEAGIKLNRGKRILLLSAKGFPVEVLFLRDDDIPQSVASGVADIGIVGENEFVERGENAQIIDRLGFSKCRLSLAIPKKIDYPGLQWFNGKKIATSYPNILRKFMKKNNINASLGVEASETNSSSQYSTYLGFVEGAKASPSNALKIKEKPTFSDSNSRRFGTYLQGNWSYDDIYLLDISGRYEGSSAFGAKKKMGLFWSSGAGLNLHNYAFLKNVSWVDRFKVKATYGVTGKANFSPYQARTTYEIMYDNPYIDQWGMSLKALGNENLKWEKVNKLNVGTELSFLQNSVTVMFDWYHELTTDQVESVSIPSSSGFTSYKGNLGKVLNQGADIRVNVRAFSNRDWDVYVFTYMNRNTNTIKEIGDALKDYNSSIDSFFKGYSSSSSDSKYSQPFTKYEVGNSLSAIYGMKSLGIDPANGKELYVKRDGTVTYDWSSSEQQCLGDYDPKLSGSFGFNLRWRNWTLYTTMAFRCGGQAYNSTLVAIENVDLEKYNGDVRILTDRWIKPGDNATLKSIKDRTYTTRPTSRFVQDDNEMTMSSLSLGYQFDHNLIKRIGIDALRLQFNAENIFTVSSIRQERGTTYPYARSFNISLNVTL